MNVATTQQRIALSLTSRPFGMLASKRLVGPSVLLLSMVQSSGSSWVYSLSGVCSRKRALPLLERPLSYIDNLLCTRSTSISTIMNFERCSTLVAFGLFANFAIPTGRRDFAGHA